jgi:excisionase family DNA binding protein
MTQATAYQPPIMAPGPNSWAELLTPMFEALDRRWIQTAEQVFTKLTAKQAAESAARERADELLNKPQAAALLGVRPKTVDAWKSKGTLPSYKLGGRIFYKRGEVMAALEAQTQPDGRRKYARRAINKKAQ